MIQPPPHKLICQKCNYSKIVSPKSDVLDPRDYLQHCPKCDTEMKKTELCTMTDRIGLFLNNMLR